MTRAQLAGLALGVLCGCANASALGADGPVYIDFEHFPGADGIIGTADDVAAPTNCPSNLCGPLREQFSPMGVTFTSGTLFQSSSFPGGNPSNHFISSTPADAVFSRLVTGISVTSFSFWTVTLYALDDNNNVIASATLTNPNAGKAALAGILSVLPDRPIRRFTVLAAGCAIGTQCDQIANIDNLILVAPAPPGPPGIPTLGYGSLAFVAVLLAAIATLTLRRRRTRPAQKLV